MARMKRARYREGVSWIANNDEPGEKDLRSVSEQVSTLLLADLFDLRPEKVARDVLRERSMRDLAEEVMES